MNGFTFQTVEVNGMIYLQHVPLYEDTGTDILCLGTLSHRESIAWNDRLQTALEDAGYTLEVKFWDSCNVMTDKSPDCVWDEIKGSMI